MEMEFSQLATLWGFVFFAGAIDAIGGGGGLVTIPALLSFGIPHPFLLGTNKCMATFGSSMAVFRYWKAGFMPEHSPAAWFLLIALALFGGGLGAALSFYLVALHSFRIIILCLLIAVMAFLIWHWFFRAYFKSRGKKPLLKQTLRQNLHFRRKLPRNTCVETSPSQNPKFKPAETFTLGIIATYDGFFGPGTGTLFLSVLENKGFSTLSANALTKVLNSSSNLGALFVFSLQAKVMWALGLPCALSYFIGGFFGSQLAIKGGQRFVRLTVLTMTFLLILRLIH